MYAQLPGFFNADAVAQKLRELVFGTDASRKDKLEGLDTRAVIVDFSCVPYVDSTFETAFVDLLNNYSYAGVLLCIANPNSAVLHRLEITGLHRKLSTQFDDDREWIFLTLSDAAQAVRDWEPPLKPVKVAAAEWEVEAHAVEAVEAHAV